MEFLPLLQAIGSFLSVIILYKLWRMKGKAIKTPRRELPEPWGAWPLIGHLHLLVGRTPMFRTLGDMADKYGPVFSIRLGMKKALVVSSSKLAKECLTTNDRAFCSRPNSAASKYMGYNHALFGFAPSGPYWAKVRKISTLELLSNSRLEMLKHLRASEVERGIKSLYQLCAKDNISSTKVNINEWFTHVMMNTMIQMIAHKRYFGVGDGDGMESKRFEKCITDFMYLTGIFEVSDVIPYTEWLDLHGNLRSMKRTAKELDYFISMWLAEHYQSRKNGSKKELDFIDVMISSLTNDDISVFEHQTDTIIKATVLTLILAGTDTTSLTLTWALSLLLNNYKTLKTAQDEIDIHVGKERCVEESDIRNLPYLQAVVKETMRLYPPGPLLIPHESIEDCYVDGYYIPKGTRLIINAWKLHRDPSVWVNPFEFQPERFLTSHAEMDVRGPQFKYIPFSYGRRSCPGATSALQMMHLTLARLLQGFNLATPENKVVDMSEGLGITMPKVTPLEVILTPRH